MKRNIFIIAWLLAAAPVMARSPLPPEQRTPRAELWLARAFVGEAGWLAEVDHAGIAWVLARRWKRQVLRWPTLQFVTVVQNYAHALGFDSKRSLTRRQLWLRSLLGPERPAHWPRGASWRLHRPFWAAARARAAAWFSGRLRDPCKGRAWHWGGDIDEEDARRKRLRPVDCGETRNTFYDNGST